MSNTIQPIQRNYGIDAFRLLGALSVVALHVSYGDMYNPSVLAIRMWGRWAVPFFFLLSGYFFEVNYSRRGEAQFAKTIRALVAIFLLSNLLYIILNLFTGSKDKLLDFHNLVNGVTGHLWFIGSMIFGYILFIYIEKKINIKYWLFISVLIYLLILAGDSYSKLLHINIEHDFVRYFVSVPFIIIGYLCSHYGIFDKKIRKYTYLYIALAVLGFVLQGLEVTYLYKLSGYGPHNQEFLLGSAVFAFGMFGLCFNITIKNNIISKLGEKYSLLVYLYHPLINIFIFEYYKPKELGGGFLFMLNPFISFSICLFVLISINKISPRIISSLNGV